MTPDAERLEQLWSAAQSRPVVGRFRTAESGVETPHGSVLVAVQDDDRRHLLVPVDAKHTFQQDVEGRAVTLRRRALEDETSYRTYAALELVDARLRDLFTALCVEVVARIDADPMRPVAAVRRTLSDWRSLLAEPHRRLGPAELAGLFGELGMLRRMVEIDPGAVAFWTGHSGSAQDFHRPAVALEVKATTLPEGRRVRIHGLGQLDGGTTGRLLLTWMRLRTDRGRSVPDLVDEVMALTDDESTFLRALHDAGYDNREREIYGRRVFEIVEEATFEVRPGFPRIVGFQLTGDAALSGIDRVHYDLDLAAPAATAALVDVDPIHQFLEIS